MERPFVKDVEGFITRFIQGASGQTVTDYLKYIPDFENADYFFQNENVLIELKCLEKDIFSDEDFERNERLVEKWFSENTLKKTDIIPIFLGRKPIPQECLLEILKLSRRTFQKIVEKANKQLRETKSKIGDIKIQKVLMICNDGNYFFDNATLFSLLCDIIGTRKEIEIDCLIYFTVNQSSQIPNSELDWAIWAPAYGENARENLELFINDLGRTFNDFYKKELKIEVSDHREYPNVKEGAESIKQMQYLPKMVIFPEKPTRTDS
jgi:hypothetical protein